MPALAGPCHVCRQWTAGGLCADCRGSFAPRVARCATCGVRTATSLAACGQCLAEPPPYGATVPAADYGFPWDGLLAKLKFHGQPEIATPLAACMDAAIEVASLPSPALVLAVPLSESRLKERGYNQAWELARRLARRRGLPTHPALLLRGRDTTHQIGLTRQERMRNLRQAFAVRPEGVAELAGRDIALVDDVLTTGATAAACTQVLLQAGARSVQVWVFARTPAPGH